MADLITGQDDPIEVDEDLKKHEAQRLLFRKQQTRSLRGKPPTYSAPSTQAKSSSAPTSGVPSRLGRKRLSKRGDTYGKVKARTTFSRPRTREEDSVTTGFKPPADDPNMATKTLDFLFGAEAAVIGIAHDSEGWSWSVDNLKKQWSEQPLWSSLLSTASLVGTMILPAGLAVRSSLKVGKLATQAGIKAKGSLKAFEASELSGWKASGMIEKDVMSYADMGGAAGAKRLRQLQLTREKSAMKLAAAKERGDEAIPWFKKDKPFERIQYEFDKRFSNTYNALVDEEGAHVQVKRGYHAALNTLWQSNMVSQVFKHMPSFDSGAKVQAHLLARVNPTLAGRATKDFGKLSNKEKQFVDIYSEFNKKGQARRFESGYLSDQEFARWGEGHLPALNLGTPDPGVGVSTTFLKRSTKAELKRRERTTAAGLVEKEVPRTGLGKMIFGGNKTIIEGVGEKSYSAMTQTTLPRLTSPTLLARTKDFDQHYDALKAGKLITDPHQFTTLGLIQDEILETNYNFVRDLLTDERFIASQADILTLGMGAEKAAQKGWIHVGQAGEGVAVRLQRMIAKRTGNPEVDLPYIRKETFDAIWGDNGMMDQIKIIRTSLLEAGTTVHKTAKTALNPATHLQNITGNLSFLSQGGFNMMAPANVAIASQMTGVFNKIAKVRAAGKKLGLDVSLHGKKSALNKVDYGKTRIGKKTFNLNDEFNDPVVRELIEESAFDAVEGSGNLANIKKRLTRDQQEGITGKFIGGYENIKNVAQLGGRAKWIEGLSKAYLAEDMIPKMTYFMSLRGQGFTRQAAAMEVGRRLPMYNTVGKTIKSGRKLVFPWLTFPTEAARITKNNIMDNPIRMLPWLRAPQIMQSLASATGIGPETRQELDEAERQLPFWAQKSTTVMGEAKAMAAIGGGATGGLVGGVAGGILGGPKGAALGAAAGAGLAGMLAAITTSEEHEGQMRGALMDFLPHSTFMLSNTSKDFGGDLLPFKNLQGALEQMPAEPFAIVRPLLDMMMGETAYGAPVGDGTLSDQAAKTMAGAIGFLAPPIVQKYMFKLTSPQVGDPTGITNVSRGLVDTGNAIDPMTGLPGSFGNDFFLNNIGVWKSYLATSEQQLSNESLTERHMAEIRTGLTRNLSFHLENGNEKESVEILSDVQGTFANQYLHDPRLAQQKYTDWLDRRYKMLGRHPKLRSWSEDELRSRIRKAGQVSGEARMSARSRLLQALRDELRVRGSSGGAGSTRAGPSAAGSSRAG